MTLAVMALYADGPTRCGIASWRVKETDRIAAMADRTAQARRQVVEGRRLHRGHAAARRLAAGVASTPTTTTAWRCACRWPPSIRWPANRAAGVPVRILDPRCVAKTFPDYFEALFGVALGRPRPTCR
jgi:3-phosphoshikimate 1-carboxyvinyltransferase